MSLIILVGIDVAKDKYDCFIQTVDGKVLYKSLSLRKTKTDKVDAKTIALMLATESDDNAYSLQAYQNEELKSLTRYRADKVK